MFNTPCHRKQMCSPRRLPFRSFVLEIYIILVAPFIREGTMNHQQHRDTRRLTLKFGKSGSRWKGSKFPTENVFYSIICMRVKRQAATFAAFWCLLNIVEIVPLIWIKIICEAVLQLCHDFCRGTFEVNGYSGAVWLKKNGNHLDRMALDFILIVYHSIETLEQLMAKKNLPRSKWPT